MNLLTRATAAALVIAFAAPQSLVATAAQGSQQQPPPAEQRLPVDMDKIREALKQNPQMRLQTDELRFYVDIIGRLPTFKEIVGDFDLKHGVVPGAPMTHEEYLSMVNREFRESGGITALDTLQTALTSYVLIEMVKRAYEEYRNARTDRERRAIQERIERELRELEKRRGGGR
ncbi:MAG TPA: hypothetical protein VFZ36_01985 [Vicinamibacterales bacterium]